MCCAVVGRGKRPCAPYQKKTAARHRQLVTWNEETAVAHATTRSVVCSVTWSTGPQALGMTYPSQTPRATAQDRRQTPTPITRGRTHRRR